MDGEEEKNAQTANGHRGMLPLASQREVPLDSVTRACGPPVAVTSHMSSHHMYGALTGAPPLRLHQQRKSCSLVTLLEGAQTRVVEVLA